jgi:hypothetical protein
VAILVVVLLGALAATSWQVGWLGSGAARADVSPMPVAQVPSSLPAGGVQIQNQGIELTPWASAPSGAMSADQAIAAARVFANAQPFPATALEADVTLPGSIPSSPSAAGSYSPVDHVPAWVVTFTSSTPIDVGQGGPGAPAVNVTHYSVAVNPVTGAFVLGFFTP